MCAFVCVCACACMCGCVCACVCMHVSVCVCPCVCVCVFACMRAYMLYKSSCLSLCRLNCLHEGCLLSDVCRSTKQKVAV